MLNAKQKPSGTAVRALCEVLRAWRCSRCPPLAVSQGEQRWHWASAPCTHGADFDELRERLPLPDRRKLPKHLRGYLHMAITMGLVRSELTARGIRYHYTGNELAFDRKAKPAPASSPRLRGRRRNDIVYTAQDFARWVVDDLQPSGKCLDPCRGRGAFYEAMCERAARIDGCTVDWCESDLGRDFLDYNEPCDWIITNPPWSVYRQIAAHAFRLAGNVGLLVRLHNAIGTAARHRDYLAAGHGLKQIIVVDWAQAGLQREGFTLALFHWERGYRGDCHWRYPILNHLTSAEQI